MGRSACLVDCVAVNMTAIKNQKIYTLYLINPAIAEPNYCYGKFSITALILLTPAEEDCSFTILNFPKHPVFST